MKNKRLVIITLCLVLGILVIALLTLKHPRNQMHAPGSGAPISFSKTELPKKQPEPASGAVSPPINDALDQLLTNHDNPLGISYEITSSSEPVAGWYVVHLVATSSYGSTPQEAIIHRNAEDGKLGVVAGPDASLPRNYLQSIGVPGAVQNQVATYAD